MRAGKGRLTVGEASAGFRASLADALDRVIDRVHDESLGERRDRDLDLLQTVGPMAHLAEEVGVHVRHRAGGVAVANLILDRSAPVLDVVDQAVLEEVAERTEDARAVHGSEHALQFGQRDGPRCGEHRLQHQDAVCRGLDAPFFQPFDVFAVVHWRSGDAVYDAKIVLIVGFSAVFLSRGAKKGGTVYGG